MNRDDPRPLIAHVVYRFDVGGLENGVANLINRLSADRYRHAIVALTEVTEFRMRIVRNDVQFFSLNKQAGQGVWQWPALRRLFAELKPAIVHTRNIAALEASVPAWLAGVPARVHGEHGWDSRDPDGLNRMYRFTRRIYRPAVHRWIALSSHIERYLRQYVGVSASRLTRICNGVDTELFRPAQARRTPIDGSPFNDAAFSLVGAVGRLQSVKDHANLIRAVGHAVRQSGEARKRMRLLIAGDGPQRAEVEAAIDAEQLREHVWLAGARDDIPAILRGLDIFALPSRAEGISNTVLEAMASGLPVIATHVGGNPDLIDDNVTGRLVPHSDSQALGEALLALLADPHHATQLGKAARAACERCFSLDRMVADYGAVYDQLLGRQRTLLVAAPGEL